jgi:hypothetical protein
MDYGELEKEKEKIRGKKKRSDTGIIGKEVNEVTSDGMN